MKSILRILGYVRSYLKYAALNVLFNVLAVLFDVFSLTMIFPFLSLLFGTQKLVSSAPPLSLDPSSFIDNFYFQLSKIIAPDGVINNEGQVNGLLFICVLVIVLFFLKNLFRYLALFFMSPIRYGVVRDIRAQVYKKLLSLPLSYYSEKRKGDIIARMTTDILEIEVSIMNSIEVVFKDPLMIIAVLTALLLMSAKLTIFVFILLPITGFLIGRVGRSLKKTSAEGQKQTGQLISLIEETISGMRVIQAFVAEKKVVDKFKRQNNKVMRTFTKMIRKRDLSSPMSEFLGVTVMVIILWFGGKMVLNDSDGLVPELFITYIVLFSRILSPSKSFSTAYYNIQKGTASLDRISEVLDAEEKIIDKPGAAAISSFENEIVYKDLSFSYDTAPTLEGINATISKGMTIALVGQSGGGKTTLANLLPRFYDYDAGSLTIDGKPIQDYKLHDLRNLMGIVTQESILFNDTVLNNIAFGVDKASKEEVVEAAKIANAHEFIEQLENGYDTNIGDSGSKLSGGQRQRLSIARAILKNPPILILDEATSSLDTESEKMVQEALFNLMKNRTSIVIAHRLSTIQHADEILVLQDGKITERGDHATLLEKKGAYSKLYELQTFA